MSKLKESKLGLIPNDWSIIKAKDFCAFVTDGTHDTPTATDEGHYLVTSKNLKRGRIDFTSSYKISSKEYDLINRRSQVDQFDLLFGMIGTVGNPTIVYENPVQFAIKNVGLFKLNSDFNKSLWLYTFLSSPLFINFLRRQQAGTTQQFVGLGFLRKIPVLLPQDPLEQKAIAGILSKVDETINAVKESINAAENLKKSLMQNLLTGKLKPDGTWRTDDEFYVDEKMGLVPKGWMAGKLGGIAQIVAGQSPSGDTYNDEGFGMPILNGPTEFTEYHPIAVQHTTKPTKVCREGDILYTVRGSSTGRMNFADQEYCIGRGLAAIRGFENSNIDFLFYTLVRISNFILAEAKGAGSTFPNVSRSELRKKKICYPLTKDEQDKIGNILKSSDESIKSQKIKIKTLERLKKSLMQNLLTGKKRVDVEKINLILNQS